MRISYDKLWNLVRQNKMKKGDLIQAANITKYSLAKLKNDESVDLSVMVNLCKVFHCDIGDLVEIKED